MWILIIIGIIVVLLGLFNEYTGLFGDTFYSPKKKKETEPEPEKKQNHRSFRMTKED